MQILQNVLTPDELTALRTALAQGEFLDGKLTAAVGAKHLKHNLQLKRDNLDATALDRVVVSALGRHPLFNAWAIPRNFSAPLYSKYGVGMTYGAHVNSAFMGQGNVLRTDLSITIFLSDPADYDGGELMIESSGAQYAFKLPPGHAVIYPTFALHQVNPVTRGERLVCVLWVQSLVRDPAMRQVLFDMQGAMARLLERDPNAPETSLLQRAYSNLMRLVIET